MSTTGIGHTTREIRAWHRRANPNTYQLWCDDAEGIYANVAVIPLLVEWWADHDLDEIDDSLIDRILALPDVAVEGTYTLRRRRTLKLILDAAREIYHLAAFTETGVSVSYSRVDDLNGIDVVLTCGDRSVKLQIAMRQGGKPYWVDTVKKMRGNFSNEAAQVVFNTDDTDQTCQPYVPTWNQYWGVVDAVFPEWTQRPFL